MWVSFTKRVGCANMHHDRVAKRDLSWAWMCVMRGQVRLVRERESNDTSESIRRGEQLPLVDTRGAVHQWLQPGIPLGCSQGHALSE